MANPSSFMPPPSSGSQKKQFAPPPVRRVASDSSPTSTTATLTPPAPPPPPPRRKDEPIGEWAEVLYDFTGDVSTNALVLHKLVSAADHSDLQPGDLDVRESQRVLIVEKPSDDWYAFLYVPQSRITYLLSRWTAELDGKRGLVPASYVKTM